MVNGFLGSGCQDSTGLVAHCRSLSVLASFVVLDGGGGWGDGGWWGLAGC